MQGLTKLSYSLNTWKKEKVFQWHVATPTYATHPMPFYKARQEACLTFPNGVQHGPLSQLMYNRVFFPAGASQGLISLLLLYTVLSPCCCFTNFLILPWKPNKMAPGHKTNKLRQSWNDYNCQIWFKSLHWLWRKCNLTIFPLEVYGRFLLPWLPNQEADYHNFSYF